MILKPEKYTKEIPDLIYEYVEKCKDTWNIVENKKSKLKAFADKVVNYPTYQGFLLYFKEKTGLFIGLKTFYKWRENGVFEDKEEWDRFMEAVEYLKLHQYVRLVNGGLSGAYKHGSVSMMLQHNHGMKEEKSEDEAIGNQVVEIIIKKDDGKDGNI